MKPNIIPLMNIEPMFNFQRDPDEHTTMLRKANLIWPQIGNMNGI
jgi:hypothetical protein